MSELLAGSRGSQLALWQTRYVMDQLSRVTPDVRCDVKVIKTTGDKILDVPLSKIGDKGLFVKEIEQALIDGEIDFAVHSAKDLPSEMDERLLIAAYPVREDPSDALVSKRGAMDALPAGSVVGTSSVRRRAQILRLRPDLRTEDLRGNLDTRLRKLDDGLYDAIVLASAGLRRLGLEARITQRMLPEDCLPAAGQGALAVQCRRGDRAAEFLRALDHAETRACVTLERFVLGHLGAGCQIPVAVLARCEGQSIAVDVAVVSLDGTQVVRMREEGTTTDLESIGAALAGRLLDSPAVDLLAEVRRSAAQRGMGAA